MKILLVGFGRINKKIFERYVSDIIGIITNEEKHINNIPDIIIDFSHPDMYTFHYTSAARHDTKCLPS